MKDNKSGWQFPKALEIIKCKEGNKEFMNLQADFATGEFKLRDRLRRADRALRR